RSIRNSRRHNNKRISRTKRTKRKTKTSRRRSSSNKNNSSNSNHKTISSETKISSNNRTNNHKAISSKNGISNRRRITSNNGIKKISRRSSRKISSRVLISGIKTSSSKPSLRQVPGSNPKKINRVPGNHRHQVRARVQALRPAREKAERARRRHRGKLPALGRVHLRR